MHNHLNVPSRALKYVLFQRTEYLFFRRNRLMQWLKAHLPKKLSGAFETFFTKFNVVVSLEAFFRAHTIIHLFDEAMKAEYSEMKSFLPKEAKNILDIGAGIGGIDLFLAKHYQGNQPTLHLLDKTEMPQKVYYGIRDQACFYNSLELSREFLKANGISNEKIVTLEANEQNTISSQGPFDVVVSLISWGFHYPVSTYLDEVYQKLSPAGVLIIDVRKGEGGMEALKNKFKTVEIIRGEVKHSRVAARK